jgi:uncharacterized protein YecA (UPF0149 family)
MAQRVLSQKDDVRLGKLFDECADLVSGNKPVEMCLKYFETWQFACRIMDCYGFESIEELLQFEEGYSVEDWAIEFVVGLEDACEIDKKYGSILIDFCREYIKRSNQVDQSFIFELKSSIAEAYFRIGGQISGDIEFDKVMKEFPQMSEGWLCWAGQYSSAEVTDANTAKAISILERARKIEHLDDREEVLIALLELHERDDPWGEKAEELSQEIETIQEGISSVDKDPDVHQEHDDDCTCGDPHHHHDNNDHQHGPDCIHSPADAPVIPGRNDPCPCGSGKKYKKCCGANA